MSTWSEPMSLYRKTSVRGHSGVDPVSELTDLKRSDQNVTDGGRGRHIQQVRSTNYCHTVSIYKTEIIKDTFKAFSVHTN